MTIGTNTSIAMRLSGCLDAGAYELEELIRLFRIETTDAVPSAAVECQHLPRLLVNPDFIDTWCKRDEHLTLLVLHEMQHILFGHTGLYDRPGPIENIAFDALINAGLLRQYRHRPEYNGFFDRLNDNASIPGCFLAPPPGWPSKPEPSVSITDPRVRRIIKALYPKSESKARIVTYREIIELLTSLEDGEKWVTRSSPPESDPTGDEVPSEGEAVLIGDHGDAGSLSIPEESEVRDVVRHIVARWPTTVRGRNGVSDSMLRQMIQQVAEGRCPSSKAFHRLLRRFMKYDPHGTLHQTTGFLEVEGGFGVVPRGADRLLAARKALGQSTLLKRQRIELRRRDDKRQPPHIYLDVSGSMAHVLPDLLDLIAPLVRRREVKLFQFSTTVSAASRDDILDRRVRTTYGTDLAPVLRHALDEPRTDRILVITDGVVGTTPARVVRQWEKSGKRLFAALPASSYSTYALQGINADKTYLPGI